MLIPIPFLDGYVEHRLNRAIFAELGAARGTPLSKDTLRLLANDRTSLLKGCLYVAVVWPLKKLFRTVLYFLTVKDVLDATARAALRAAMVEEALDAGLLPARADEVRARMDLVLERFRVSPLTRAMGRYERPELDTPPGSPAVVRLVLWLARHAGAGVVLPAFRAALAEVPS